MFFFLSVDILHGKVCVILIKKSRRRIHRDFRTKIAKAVTIHHHIIPINILMFIAKKKDEEEATNHIIYGNFDACMTTLGDNICSRYL